MRLFEFADDDPLRVKLTAVTNQLKDRLTDDPRPVDTKEFLDFLKANDIVIDLSDLYDIVKKEPLVNIIHNVNKDKVIFKGQKGAEEMPDGKPDENKKIVQQLANKQTNKLK